MKRPADIPICPYCNQISELVKGDAIYPHREDLAGKDFYRCQPCRAWVGCHRGTLVPLGRLANAELRRAKGAAHAAFDRLWRQKMQRDRCSKRVARGAGYAWLARELSIDPAACHIGMMDVAACNRVTELCRQYGGGQQ